MDLTAIIKAYATLIHEGRKNIDDVPEHIRNEVQDYIDNNF